MLMLYPHYILLMAFLPQEVFIEALALSAFMPGCLSNQFKDAPHNDLCLCVMQLNVTRIAWNTY